MHAKWNPKITLRRTFLLTIKCLYVQQKIWKISFLEYVPWGNNLCGKYFVKLFSFILVLFLKVFVVCNFYIFIYIYDFHAYEICITIIFHIQKLRFFFSSSSNYIAKRGTFLFGPLLILIVHHHLLSFLIKNVFESVQKLVWMRKDTTWWTY